MATVYLLDVNQFALRCSCPPLSWWCAGELAQWTSTVALRDAWAAAGEQCEFSVSHEESDKGVANRSSYISFDNDGDNCGHPSTSLTGAAAKQMSSVAMKAVTTRVSSPSIYQLRPFPSTVDVQNKYFSVSLSLMAGCRAMPTYHECHAFSNPTEGEVTAALSQIVPPNLTGEKKNSYGGVLTADVRQDPAEVPWHVLPRGHGCAFRVVMVFLDKIEDSDAVESTTSESTTPQLFSSRVVHSDPEKEIKKQVSVCDASSEQKERWQYFAVENGYECVFHGPIASAAGDDVSLKAVSVASGRRGLLEAPLQGSDRLYQILCNTLWPTEVRREAEGCRANAVKAHQQADTHPGNTFIVVANSMHVVKNIFDDARPPESARTRRQLRFFTKFVQPQQLENVADTALHTTIKGERNHSSPSKAANDDHPSSEGASSHANTISLAYRSLASISQPSLVLVNKYYAAVVKLQLLQTAFFAHSMQDMLDRYWEQHFTAEGSLQKSCTGVLVMVMWPPSPTPSSSFSCVVQQTDFIVSRHDESEGNEANSDYFSTDTRSAYPPLETILDALTRHGCSEIVVVTPAIPDKVKSTVHRKAATSKHAQVQAELYSLTPYEKHVCAERSVEVVDLNAPHASVSDIPALPVLCDEDDVCATRAVDRLEETLHCVQWSRSYPLTYAIAKEQRMRSANSCLLLAYGQDAFEEEAWMGEVVKTLRPMVVPAIQSTGTLASDMDILVASAPSIAFCFSDPLQRSPNRLHPPSYLTKSTNAYFTAVVQMCLRGGLWRHYCAGAAPGAAVTTAVATEQTSSLQPTWLELYDGFVLVTSLRVLREAVAAVKTVVQTQPSYGSCVAELIYVLNSLAQKAAEWLLSQQTTGTTACTDTPVDTPLALIYITDVPASDKSRTALAEECLYTIVKATRTDAENDDGSAFLPIEIVFSADTKSTCPVGATAAWDTPVDGMQRVREAFEQQLWPRRQPLRRHVPALVQTDKAAGLGMATDVSAEHASIQPDETQEKTVSVDVAASTDSCSRQVDQVQSATSALPLRVTLTNDVMWIAPTIGCALPPGFLVDPETLRSVSLQPVCGARPAAPTRAQDDPESVKKATKDDQTHSATCQGEEKAQSEAAQAASPSLIPLTHPLSEKQLMMWMEKMKIYGHRLGETQRKEQAATLALALEALL